MGKFSKTLKIISDKMECKGHVDSYLLLMKFIIYCFYKLKEVVVSVIWLQKYFKEDTCILEHDKALPLSMIL